MSLSSVLIHPTIDQCTVNRGKEKNREQAHSLGETLVYTVIINNERLHCYWHFGSLFLTNYSNT